MCCSCTRQGLTFLRSLIGSLRALTIKAAADGITETVATRFCTVSLTVTRSPFHSLPVSLAISSPIFLGDRPRGPIFGAREDAAPISPPRARTYTSTTAEGSNLGAMLADVQISRLAWPPMQTTIFLQPGCAARWMLLSSCRALRSFQPFEAGQTARNLSSKQSASQYSDNVSADCPSYHHFHSASSDASP